jgi:drug/metabolite transporter (DMT)-like permease
VQDLNRPIYALWLRLASAASFATMFLLVKLAGQSGVALPEIMFWRQFISVPVILVWLSATRRLHHLKTERLGGHALRAGVGMTGMVCSFGATLLLPLAESTVLGFTAPLFAVILTALVLREHVGPWRWLAVLLGFLGVVIVAQPSGAPISTLGAAGALASGLVTASIAFMIRSLGRTEKSISVVFYFSLLGSVLLLPVLPFYLTAHSSEQWLILVAIGLIGMLGQLLMTASVRYGPIASVIVMDYTALIWATLFGWLVWHYLPSPATWIGAPLIVAAGVVIAWREHRLSRKIAPPVAFSSD